MPQMFPSRYARSLLRMLPAGSSVDEVLAECDLTRKQLEADHVITVSQYSRLFVLVIRHLQPLLHGDEAERLNQFSNYRLIMHSMVQAPDLREALQRFDALIRRFLPEVSGCPIKMSNGQVYWCFEFPSEEGDAHWPVSTFSRKQFNWGPGIIGHANSLWIWHRLVSWLVGCFIEISKVDLVDKRPSHPDRYHALFNCPLHFGQSQCCVSFPQRYLDYPIVRSTEQVDEMLDRFPEEMFTVGTQGLSTSSRIRAMIGGDLSRSFPTIEEIAERLNVSVPTLHRHLQKENTRYQKIKDDCRLQAALDYLRRDNLQVGEISRLLGYSDTSTFYRAFRKWTGMTPSEFRSSEQ